MDELIRAGGPAFPVKDMPTEHGGGFYSPGMTLRDYFAAAALNGRLAAERHRTDEDGVLGYPELAMEAYALADAMLREREKE